jgi:hypothetical protein
VPKFAIFCFLCQFSLLGAELWFFVMSRDMYLTVSNPFSSYKKQATLFGVFVFTVAAFLGCLLVGFGPGIYGLSSDPMIWIQVACICSLYRIIVLIKVCRTKSRRLTLTGRSSVSFIFG